MSALMLTACSSDSLAPNVDGEVAALRATASASGATLPFEKSYVRAVSTPVTDVMTLDALDASQTEEVTVRITNGGGDQRATSGLVQVGGVTVLDENDFPFTERVVQVNIGTARPVRVLSRITGRKGGSYTVRVEAGAPVSPEGGSVSVAGGDVRIAVPAGAVSGALSISAEPVVIPPSEDTYEAYDFGPDGTTFDKPITLTFPVPSTPLPAGGVPGLFWRQNENDEWQPLANGRFDAQAGTVSGDISHFTQVGVRVKEMRVCPTGANAVTTVAEAISKVSRRGTILLCDAQHDVTGVLIDKPVTITSADPTPARIVSSGTSSFRVSGVARDSVIIRRLAFAVETGDTAITADGTFDAVQVDSSSFALASTARASVYAGTSTVNDARLTMLTNVITGGLRGVHVVGTPLVRIRENQFTTQDSANIDVLADAAVRTSGEVSRNRIRECGTVGCIRLGEVASVQADSNDIASNPRSFIDALGRARVITSGIIAFGTDVRITGNRIVGTNVTNLADQLTYVWSDAGVYVVTLSSTPSSTIVNDNYIEGGRRAFAVQWLTTYTVEPVFSGANNTATRNFRVAQSVGSGRIRLTRGNYAEYVLPLVNGSPIAGRTGWSAGDMTCNYWGTPQGPVFTSSGGTVTLPMFLPAATQPIANTSIGCDPTPIPMPAMTRFCSTGGSVTDVIPTFNSMSWAAANTAANGTLEVCSGTHAPGRTVISSPINIRGEAGATKPTLNGTLNGFSTQVFFVENAVGGTTTIRNLRFTNSRFESVRVAGANGPVIVEDNVFEPLTDPAPANGVVGFFAGVAVFSSGDTVRIRNNSFSGGNIGVNTFTQFNVVISNNSFANHSNGAITLGGGAETFAVVNDNVVDGCGPQRCFLVNNTKVARLQNNTLNISFKTPRTIHGLDLFADSLVVTGNTIAGTDGTRTSDNNTWPALIGIKIFNGRKAIIDNNSISKVFSAMRFDAAQVTGRDNVVDQVYTGLDARNGTTTMTRSNFTNYVEPFFVFSAPAGAPFACNYWGTTTGPTNPVRVVPGNYSPFSTVLIANTNVSCTP